MDENKFSNLIENIEKINHDNKYVKSILIEDNDKIYEKNFSKEISQTNIRSMTKTILALICSIVIEKSNGNLTIDDYIYPIISDKLNLTTVSNLKYLKEIKIKHLLNQTSGFYKFDLSIKNLDEKNKKNLLNYIVNGNISYKPGERFYYTNANYELLSIILEEFFKNNLYEFSKTYFFEKLGIENLRWEKSYKYLSGSSNLYLYTSDLKKIGDLLLNFGKYKGEQIIPKHWIKDIANSPIDTNFTNNNVYLNDSFYGYGIWLSKKDLYYASGSKGQLLIIIANKKMQIIILSDNDLPDKSKETKKVIDKLLEDEIS